MEGLWRLGLWPPSLHCPIPASPPHPILPNITNTRQLLATSQLINHQLAPILHLLRCWGRACLGAPPRGGGRGRAVVEGWATSPRGLNIPWLCIEAAALWRPPALPARHTDAATQRSSHRTQHPTNSSSKIKNLK